MKTSLLTCVANLFRHLRRDPRILAPLILVLICTGCQSVLGDTAKPRDRESSMLTSNDASGRRQTSRHQPDYVVIAWNDLGMHCINPSFKELAILPPYNTLMAQVIKRGEPPQIVTSGVSLHYSIAGNTTVHDKIDFWEHAQALFGTSLPEGVGLTGNGLSGAMQATIDHFEAKGIPVLPRDDSMTWNPYQQAVITLQKEAGAPSIEATVQVTIPVSDELNCAKCHGRRGKGAANVRDTGTVDGNILAVHDSHHPAYDLLGHRPVLCASCHADNALGAPGNGNSTALSLAMHGWHSRLPEAGCYDCHPGAKTQCYRTAIGGMGYSGTEPNCEMCHGGLKEVEDSIAEGRKPWLEEPTCVECHGKNYSTGENLYRNARGHAHGKVYCAACHGSPHAWWPSTRPSDNTQPIAYQGEPFAIRDCSICHTTEQNGHNPHATYLPPRGD